MATTISPDTRRVAYVETTVHFTDDSTPATARIGSMDTVSIGLGDIEDEGSQSRNVAEAVCSVLRGELGAGDGIALRNVAKALDRKQRLIDAGIGVTAAEVIEAVRLAAAF